MRLSSLIALTLAIAMPFGCRAAESPAPSYCRHVGDLDDLRALYEEHATALVILDRSVWLCSCGQPRRLAGATEDRRLAGVGEDRRTAGDTEARDRAGDDEQRRLAGDTEARRDLGDTEGRRLAGDTEDRDRAGDDEQRALAGDAERRDLGGAAEERRLAGHTEVPSCAAEPSCAGFVVYASTPDIHYFNGWETRSADDHCVLP